MCIRNLFKTDDIEELLDRLSYPVMFISFIVLLILLFNLSTPSAFADTGEVVVRNETELVQAINDGEERINIYYLHYDFNKDTLSYLRTLPGSTRCISRNSSLVKDAEGNAIAYKPRYDCNRSEIASREAAYWSEIDRIANSASGSQFDKASYVYSVLLDRCTYNNAAVNDWNIYHSCCTATSALLNGNSICAGYAQALVDLFNAVGIEAWLEESPQHAWVGCVVDGQRLTCDPTNDDKNNTRDYFLQYQDKSLYRPADVTIAQTTTEETPSINITEDFIDVKKFEVIDLNNTKYASKPSNRVPIEAVRVGVLKSPLTPANQTIYMPVKKGFFSPFEYKGGITFYAPATSQKEINGKPVINLTNDVR